MSINNKIPESNQEVMEALFPDWTNINKNALNPIVTRYDNINHPVVVSMLYIGNKEFINNLKKYNNENHDVATVFCAENNNKIKEHYDLKFELEFLFEKKGIKMGGIITSDIPDKQSKFIQALYEVDKFYIFIAEENGKLVKVKKISWEASEHDNVLKMFLTK